MHSRNRFKLACFLVGLGFGISLTAFADEPPRVMVSVKPVHSLVAGLMEGVADPELIMTEGTPGTYRPSPEQKAALAEAGLVIWLGPDAEPGLADDLASPSMDDRSLELLSMESIKVLPAREGGEGRDPFIWLDTRNMLILLDELSQELTAVDPIRAHRYEANRLKMLKRLSHLDRTLEYGYREVSAVPVFTYHDTHQYFEQAYAMKVVAIAAVDGETATAESLLQMRGLLGTAPNPCVLTEAALEEPHLELVMAGTDARPVEIDSFGSELAPGPDLYERMMRDQFARISDCIGTRSLPSIMPIHPPAEVVTAREPELYGHRIQGKYLLMNEFGESVSNLDFAGSYQLIYFGYTFCPDICPTSLAIMTKALKLLGPKAERIQPLFISVDPERDTLQALRQYTDYFDPRLLGLTGPPDMIARTAAKFHVRYEKVSKQGEDPDKYAVDHTSALFLLGPNSEFIAKFAHGFPAPDLAMRLDELIPD